MWRRRDEPQDTYRDRVTPDPYDDHEIEPATTRPSLADAPPPPTMRAGAPAVVQEVPRRRETDVRETDVVVARGGVAIGAVLTGVLVAFGAMLLLSALAAGIIAALDLTTSDVTGNVTEIGVGAGVILVIAQLLAYLWGGYTAGRMARGAGVVNGMLVPVTALVIGGIVAAIVAAMGADANLNMPFTNQTITINEDAAMTLGIGIGIATLLAMFVGAMVGGGLGARWHTKLEHREMTTTYRAA